jgi:hypothetical protein
LDVQTCFAGAPLLPNMTKEIFFRMINVPQTDCRLCTFVSFVYASNKNAFGLTHPQASQLLKFGNLAVLAPIGFRPAVLRRHLSVTLPFRLKTYLV